MKRARFIADARREFLAEVGHYEEAAAGAGARFAAAVQEAAVRALAFPLAGSPAEAGTRRVIVKGFSFSIFYRPDQDGIIVFAVAHQARQPGYWRSRTR
ncbi:MAG: type II toxin-antitoxin system RelE/ParE family toxin [Pseudomonadota bacterium]